MTSLRNLYHRLLRAGFRLLYNEMAWSYDFVSWAVSLGQWKHWQRAGLPFLTGPRVLEVAFGTGAMLVALRRKGLDTCGIDLSSHMAAIARRKLRRAGLDAPIVRGSAAALPFAGDTFDAILTTFPTPFIRDPNVLHECARVLRPRGRLVIVDRATMTRPYLIARFIEWLYVITNQRPDWALSQATWLEQTGWDVEEREERLRWSVVHLFIARQAEDRSEGRTDNHSAGSRPPSCA